MAVQRSIGLLCIGFLLPGSFGDILSWPDDNITVLESNATFRLICSSDSPSPLNWLFACNGSSVATPLTSGGGLLAQYRDNYYIDANSLYDLVSTPENASYVHCPDINQTYCGEYTCQESFGDTRSATVSISSEPNCSSIWWEDCFVGFECSVKPICGSVRYQLTITNNNSVVENGLNNVTWFTNRTLFSNGEVFCADTVPCPNVTEDCRLKIDTQDVPVPCPPNITYCVCDISDFMTAEITMSSYQTTFVLLYSIALVGFYIKLREFTAFSRILVGVGSAMTAVMASGQVIGSSISLADLLGNSGNWSVVGYDNSTDIISDTESWLIGTLSMQSCMVVGPIVQIIYLLLWRGNNDLYNFITNFIPLSVVSGTCLGTMIWSDIQGASLTDACGDLYAISMTWEISLITMGASAIVTVVIIYLLSNVCR